MDTVEAYADYEAGIGAEPPLYDESEDSNGEGHYANDYPEEPDSEDGAAAGNPHPPICAFHPFPLPIIAILSCLLPDACSYHALSRTPAVSPCSMLCMLHVVRCECCVRRCCV